MTATQVLGGLPPGCLRPLLVKKREMPSPRSAMRAMVSAEGGFFVLRFFFIELFAFYTLLLHRNSTKTPECQDKP